MAIQTLIPTPTLCPNPKIKPDFIFKLVQFQFSAHVRTRPPKSNSSYRKCENRGPIPGQFQADPTTLKPYHLVPVPAIPDWGPSPGRIRVPESRTTGSYPTIWVPAQHWWKPQMNLHLRVGSLQEAFKRQDLSPLRLFLDLRA